MAWVKLTAITGEEIIHINLDQVVAIEPYEQSGHKGAKVRTSIYTKGDRPVEYFVRESPTAILGFAHSS